MLIVPQFLADTDVHAHNSPETYLHWNAVNWEGGDNANGPIPASSFEALDAILARLADRTLFPNLKTVVLAGHSGGAQVVQHYAVVGKGETVLADAGIHVRYVVANPSTYLYFSEERPVSPDQSCPEFNQWKYGWSGAPAYAQAMSQQAYEAAYAGRDVVYLLGTNDTNPNQAALDKSCSAETQGPYRLARGIAFFDYLQRRNPTMTTQRIVKVEGVGHDGDAMFTSPNGLAVLFDDQD
jgi:pimeloyl-ACP methyl ester carboxylesterase